MKKVLLLILSCSIAISSLYGCSGSNITSNDLETSSSSTATVEPISTTEPTPTPEPAADLGLSYDDCLSALQKAKDVEYGLFFSGDKYDVQFIETDAAYTVFLIANKGETNVKFCRIDVTDNMCNSTNKSFIDDSLEAIEEASPISTDSSKDTNESPWTFFIFPYGKDSEIAEVSVPINDLRSDSDPLKSEETREQIEDMAKAGNYKGIRDIIADENNAIVKLIDPVIQYQDLYTSTYDDVEDKIKVEINGQTELSDTICVVPYCDGNLARVKTGFRADDWLFWDTVILSPDNGENTQHYVKSYDKETNVIDGGIEEYFIFSADSFESIFNAENVTVRFKNSENDEYKDFQLTQEEILGIKIVDTLANLSNRIRDLMYTPT